MTHLLGRQDCVDSLRRDLIDLQGAVLEVFSRTGPVRFPSWKYPDKLSCNLDLVYLLEQYDYVEGDEEFSQHSHIVLLELVIDRMMLLVQSFNAYADLMLGGQRTSRSCQPGVFVSLGPLVKRYWNNVVQLSKQQQWNVSQVSSPQSTSTCPVQRPLSSEWQHNTLHSNIHASTQSPHSAASASSLHRTALPGGPAGTRSLGSQTAESSLTPCEACARVQASLKESADALVVLCQSLGLPCSLQRLLVAVEDSLQLGSLTTGDVEQWASEQRRDMGRLGKHILEVRGTVEPLREGRARAEEEREKLRKQLEKEKETAERDREERRRREKEWEHRLQEVKASGEMALRRVQEEKEELRRVISSLEEGHSRLTAELSVQGQTSQSLDCERERLQEEVTRLQAQEVTWRAVGERGRDLERELSSTQLLLEKENAKYHSALRQHAALQMKQRALSEQLEVQAQRCEDLQALLDESNDQRDKLTHTNTHTTQERDALLERLTQHQSECVYMREDREQLQARVCELKRSVCELGEELRQAAQRERVLVAFPELSPLQHVPQSTGDVLGDMEQQVQANCVRIRVLEQENTSLTNSLAKLRQTRLSPVQQQGSSSPPDAPPDAQHRPLHNPSPQTQTASAGFGLRDASPPLAAPSSASVVRQQTLCLSLAPGAAETYARIQRVARSRSAGTRNRRK